VEPQIHQRASAADHLAGNDLLKHQAKPADIVHQGKSPQRATGDNEAYFETDEILSPDSIRFA
jgi:hypothetical protein